MLEKFKDQDIRDTIARAVADDNAGAITFYAMKIPDIDKLRDDCGMTLLQNAVCEKKYTSAMTLLALRAAPDLCGGPAGYTALHYAVYADDTRMAEMLLAAKANTEIPDHNGCTALHVAAYMGRDEIVCMLVESGANIYAETQTGQTPLEITLERRRGGVTYEDQLPYFNIAKYLEERIQKFPRGADGKPVPQRTPDVQLAKDLKIIRQVDRNRFKFKPS